MKLNLLPATINKGAAARNAWIATGFLTLAGVGAAAFMIISSKSELESIKQQVQEAQPGAARALATSQAADTVILQAEPFLRNTKIARAMLAHNTKYPDFMDKVRTWVPSFYRITQITVTPLDATSTQVSLLGTVDTYQQYADLPLAFLRHKEVTAVGRGQYVLDDKQVPSLSSADQIGMPRKANQGPIPSDPLERLAYFESQVTSQDYLGVSNYGSATTDTRLAMPNSSYVSIQLTVSADLTVPDVRGSLGSSGGGAAASLGGGMPMGGAPMPGGFPGSGGAAARPGGGGTAAKPGAGGRDED